MTTILIVDDTPMFRETIGTVLRAEGYNVLAASNGAEALSVISKDSPDLVVLDLGMPVMDGLTLLREMRKDRCSERTPVLVLSGDSDPKQIDEAKKLGITDCLVKSQFSLKILLERVKSAMAAAA